MPYYLIFQDIHNFYIDKDSIEKIFNKDFLNMSDSIKSNRFDLKNYNKSSLFSEGPTVVDIMQFRKVSEHWQNRYFPETLSENKKIFFDYLELCDKFNVTPIVTVFPVMNIWRKFFPKCLVEEFICIINEAQKKHNFHFINKSNFDDQLNEADFKDTHHLLISGARKISTFINDYIMRLEHNKN